MQHELRRQFKKGDKWPGTLMESNWVSPVIGEIKGSSYTYSNDLRFKRLLHVNWNIEVLTHCWWAYFKHTHTTTTTVSSQGKSCDSAFELEITPRKISAYIRDTCPE